MSGLQPENLIQVTATRESVTASSAMPVATDVTVTLRLETNYKVCDVTIRSGETTSTVAISPSSIVRSCNITLAPVRDGRWRYVLQNDTVDIPLYPRVTITPDFNYGRGTVTVTADSPVYSAVTVYYTMLSGGQELCRLTIPAGGTTATGTYITSSSSRQVSARVIPERDEVYLYSPDVTIKTVPANVMEIQNIATATTITSTTNRWGGGRVVTSDVTVTIRLRGSSEVFATVVIPAGSNSATIQIEPSSQVRNCEIGWGPGSDTYMQYTMDYFLTIPAQT